MPADVVRQRHAVPKDTDAEGIGSKGRGVAGYAVRGQVPGLAIAHVTRNARLQAPRLVGRECQSRLGR